MFKSSFCTEFFAVTLHDRPVHILPPRFHGRNSSENRLLYRKPMPGHARTVSECARACQNHARSAPARAQGVPERARTMPARVSNDLWGSLYPSVDKLPQRSFNTRRRPCRGLSRHKRTDAGSRFPRSGYHKSNDSASAALRRIQTGARRQLPPSKPLL